MDVEQLAENYDMDADNLKALLAWMLQRYREKESEYLNLPEQHDLERDLADIRKKAEQLTHALDKAQQMTVQALEGQDMLVHHAQRDLRLLGERIASVSVDVRGHAPMFHRNALLLSLQRTWELLTGEAPDQSTGVGSFYYFIDDACEVMDLDAEGLWQLHREGVE